MQFQTLNKKDKIGLITPAGTITKQKLDKAVQNMKLFGLKTCYFENVLSKTGYLAGNDSERIEELHKMYADKSVKAILCVRGGYGTTRLLDNIDYDLIKNNPKPLIGYSDITALHSAIYKNTSQIGFHGIVGASVFNKFTARNFNEMFFGNNEHIKHKVTQNKDKEHYTITQGKASGILIGGNLSILNSLLATPFDLDWTDKIVFIEDVNEPPYKIDRLLTQLISARKFDRVKGIIFGTFNKCEGSDFKVEEEDTFKLRDILFDRIKTLKIPSAYGFSFGHIKDQIILPIGAKVDFDAENLQINIKKDFFQ